MKKLLSALAALSLLASTAFAQCNAGRQIDTTNLNLGLQGQAVPQGGGCVDGQCGARTSVEAQISRFNGLDSQFSAAEHAELDRLLAKRAAMAGMRVAVDTGSIDVHVARTYKPLTVTTVVPTEVTKYRTYETTYAPARVSATIDNRADVRAEVFSSTNADVLAFDPSVDVRVAAGGCASGNCGGGARALLRPFKRFRARLGAKEVNIARSTQIIRN